MTFPAYHTVTAWCAAASGQMPASPLRPFDINSSHDMMVSGIGLERPMKATNEQIMAEAKRRWGKTVCSDLRTVEDFIIEVTREGWTPAKPVDPDMLAAVAYRDWLKTEAWTGNTRLAFIAGAEWGRKQEQERKSDV